MAVDETDPEAVLRRLTTMGIPAQLMPGGDCVLARMRLQRRLFETPTTPIAIDQVTFATVGRDRAKCVEPRTLFGLPMLRIADCRDATAIEARIHLAWQRHSAELAKTAQWLRSIGARSAPDESRSTVELPLSGEAPGCVGRMIDPNRVILPSCGTLSGIPLRRVDDRLLRVDTSIDNGTDLEMSVTTRLQQLARLEARLRRQEQHARTVSGPTPDQPAAERRRPAVLLVGPKITREQECIEALKLRGNRVLRATGQRDALAAFDACSPELVLADTQLDRAEGVELIAALREVPGIEEVPVVLVDTQLRPERKELARRIGAAGYIVYPLDVHKIVERLERIVDEPRRRRFTRYPEKLAVKISGHPNPWVTTAIGRGGMALAAVQDLPTNTLHECQIMLPGTGARLRIEGEVLYHARAFETASPAVGMRFRSFPDADEPVLIRYLKNLHPSELPPPL